MTNRPEKKCTACDARRRKKNRERMQKPVDPQNRRVNPTDVSEDLHKPRKSEL